MTAIKPFGGFGLGLRKTHYADFLETDVPVDFVEVISENYMAQGGKHLRILEEVRAKHPVILHGVSMSIGAAHGLDPGYLASLRRLAEQIEPLWVSDHLCWTRTSAHNSFDLLPLPLTHDALDAVCDNIDHAQETLGQAMLFENPSSYVTFPEDEMAEWEFLAAMAQRTGCGLLLDVNNIYVSSQNHGWSAQDYIAGIPASAVRQMHLAGHTPGEIIVDTHDRPVVDAVWDLFVEAYAGLGDVAVMIERDDAIPPLPELLEELGKARALGAEARETVQ
ncbi:MNIO family bufferin maturase [Erythrobacter sp. W53]|uniref:MNIO family bufferin maturase n=1 Tax=Erythrobacter sp. W53 TaxID=3425947 RepID=UPI003D768D57